MEMTMDKQLSSEEKLLSIIRKKGPDDAVKAKNKKAADGRTKTPGRPLSLPLLNRFLVFAVIGGLALFEAIHATSSVEHYFVTSIEWV
jgi:hypothetical protein